MGTRSLTIVYDDNKKLVTMYRHFDGYPRGHGNELADFLLNRKLINGISINDDAHKTANGMDCLAALLVSHFKGDSAGSIYLVPHRCRADQEYEYHVHEDRVVIKSVYGRRKTIFSGTWSDFKHFCENQS